MKIKIVTIGQGASEFIFLNKEKRSGNFKILFFLGRYVATVTNSKQTIYCIFFKKNK